MIPTSEDIQGYFFQNRAFESEDDKEPEKLLKAGAAFMEVSFPLAKDWHYLFSRVCEEGTDINDTRVEMHDFCLNLAASDPVEHFAPEEMGAEGNLFMATLLLLGLLSLFVWARFICSMTSNSRLTA